MWIGFFTVALTDEPSPNDQDHEVGVLVEASVKATVNGAVPETGVLVEASVKVTFSGAVPETGVPVKLATGAIGAAATVIYFVRVVVLPPAALVAVNATV